MTCKPPTEEASPWLSSQRCLWMLLREQKKACCSGKDQIKKKAAWKYVSAWVVLSLLFRWEETCVKNTLLLTPPSSKNVVLLLFLDLNVLSFMVFIENLILRIWPTSTINSMIAYNAQHTQEWSGNLKLRALMKMETSSLAVTLSVKWKIFAYRPTYSLELLGSRCHSEDFYRVMILSFHKNKPDTLWIVFILALLCGRDLLNLEIIFKSCLKTKREMFKSSLPNVIFRVIE